MFKFETPKKSFIPWNFLPTALAALQSSETRKNDHYQLIPVPLKKADGTPRETTKIAFEGLSSLKVLQGKMAALDPDADYFLSPLCKSAQESVLSTSENLENTEGQRTEEKSSASLMLVSRFGTRHFWMTSVSADLLTSALWIWTAARRL
jgi:hypothetical protein